MNQTRPYQFTLWGGLLVITGLCFVLAKPATAVVCAVSLAALALGAILVRSAAVDRRQGWVSGLIFGLGILLVGVVACACAGYLLVVSWLSGGK